MKYYVVANACFFSVYKLCEKMNASYTGCKLQEYKREKKEFPDHQTMTVVKLVELLDLGLREVVAVLAVLG